MSSITIYKCDKCKVIVPEESDLWEISVGVRNKGNYRTIELPKSETDVCRDCRDLLNLNITDVPEVSGPPPRPTIEDLIAEIAGDAARDYMDNN